MTVLITRLRLLGAGTAAISIAVLGWWWTSEAGRSSPFQLSAVVPDAALFTAFALHHSVLARVGAKRWAARFIPDDQIRTLYVATAGLLLIATCVWWQPVGGALYEATGAAGLSCRVVQLLGAAIGWLSLRQVSVRELIGLAEPGAATPLQFGGPYRLVRHPLYSSLLLMLGATPRMTGDRLLFVLLAAAYIILAIPFEEAGLVHQHGDAYEVYRRRVPSRLIPYIL